jgi:hypothetical protein
MDVNDDAFFLNECAAPEPIASKLASTVFGVYQHRHDPLSISTSAALTKPGKPNDTPGKSYDNLQQTSIIIAVQGLP